MIFPLEYLMDYNIVCHYNQTKIEYDEYLKHDKWLDYDYQVIPCVIIEDNQG